MIEDKKTKPENIFGRVTKTSKLPKSFDREEHETEDRSKIARTLIYSFLGGLGLIIIGIPLYNYFVIAELRIDLFSIITTYSGVLGSFVGVIAGYYFKS